jgi:hypothetical protein
MAFRKRLLDLRLRLSWEAQPQGRFKLKIGKAEPYRTEGGKAALALQTILNSIHDLLFTIYQLFP